MRFRLTFWATIAFIPVFMLLMYLGTWQVQRLQWKNNLIQTRIDRIASSPLEFAAAREAASPQVIEYRPITISGLLRNDHRFRLLNRVHNSHQGSHMVVPMVLDSGQGTIMVDRGWIPRGLMRDIPAEPVARVVLNGYVRAYTERTPFLPPNEPDRNNWFHMHEAEMLTASGLMSGVGFYVEAGPNVQAPDLLPTGAVPDVNLRNNHLQYAGTWYGVGAVLFIVFIVFHWRRDPL